MLSKTSIVICGMLLQGEMNAYDMLKIATVGGAKMLGREELGSLEDGKGADLFIIDADTSGM